MSPGKSLIFARQPWRAASKLCFRAKTVKQKISWMEIFERLSGRHVGSTIQGKSRAWFAAEMYRR
jgi:hypothetical protein